MGDNFNGSDEEPEQQDADESPKRTLTDEISDLPPQEMNYDFDKIEGVICVDLPTATQELLKCVPGIDVTLESSWKYVSKQLILDNLEAYKDNEQFLKAIPDINEYEGDELLLGHIENEDADENQESYYLCTTNASEQVVSKMVKNMEERRAEIVRSLVERQAKKWNSKGSEDEIKEYTFKNNRPLLMVEVAGEYPFKKKPPKLRSMYCKDFRDGYVEFLPGRTVYDNVIKKRIDASVQVTPTHSENFAQTVYSFPKHVWSQYEYAYKDVKALDVKDTLKLTSFLNEKVDYFEDSVFVNAHVNLYTDDYVNLVRDGKFTKVPKIDDMKEYTSLLDPTQKLKIPISSVSWHPMWTGIVAVSHSRYSLSYYNKKKLFKSKNYKSDNPDFDEVSMATYEVMPVFIWSLKDTLFPRLRLTTPRDITILSFCPYNPNLLVGGCVNGQLVVWDITNKIESLENPEYLNKEQQEYRNNIRYLMQWTQWNDDTNYVHPVIISELQHSHTCAVTSIKWFSPYHEISQDGQIKEIGENENRISLIFFSSSTDGSILIWDLGLKTVENICTQRSKPLRHLERLPAALIHDVSPFKTLNHSFIPIFKINIPSERPIKILPLTGLSFKETKMEYVTKHSDADKLLDITETVCYAPVFNPTASTPIDNEFIATTTNGDLLTMRWEGLPFSGSGEKVNSENATIVSFVKFHDGPITSVSRSELFSDLILTVGGKVFALWKSAMSDRPVLWRRSRCLYTHGSWISYRPSMFSLTRYDGAIEFWHLKSRSIKYHSLVSISSSPLMGSFVHPKKLSKDIIAIADAKGSLQLFFAPQNLTSASKEDIESTNKFCERELTRKQAFIKWQSTWLAKNQETVASKQAQMLNLEKDVKGKPSLFKSSTILIQQKPSVLDKTKEARELKEKANKKEKERLLNVLLDKKQLNYSKLEKDRQPVLELEKKRERKLKKLKQRRGQADEIFEKAVAVNFPYVLHQQEEPAPDPYAKHVSGKIKAAIMEDYKKLSSEATNFIQNNRYEVKFDWTEMLKAGKHRRNIINRFNVKSSHRERFETKENVESACLGSGDQ